MHNITVDKNRISLGWTDRRPLRTYIGRLNRLGLPTSELRPLKLDLIFCYNIVFGVTSLIGTFSSAATQTPEVTLINYTYRKTLVAFGKKLSYRILPVWNSLPADRFLIAGGF